MVAFGRYIFIFNTTEETVKDLYFIYPIVNTSTKVKACFAHRHITEMVVDTAYQGEVSFYFEDTPSTFYTFAFPDTTKHNDVDNTQSDNFNLYLKIERDHEKRILIIDENRESYND